MVTIAVKKIRGLKLFCFVSSGLQNIHLDIDIQHICGLEADIKKIETYHIFGQPICKMAGIKVSKMFSVAFMCIKILYVLSVPLKMYI